MRPTSSITAAACIGAGVIAGIGAGPEASAAPPPDPTLPADVRAMIEAMRLPARGDAAPSGDGFVDAGRGPIPVIVPASYDPDVPAPLVILLHGYTSSGADVESWMRLSTLVDEFGFLYLFPDGTTDCFGQRFWNATDACCNFCSSGVDDSGYLLALIDAVRAEYSVDGRRIHFVGHSNGGFMSYRMACDHAETVASIASLAGATFLNPNDCAPASPVHVLQMHGTADAVIAYGGGCIFGDCYPGAVESVEQWAAFDGCSLTGDVLPDPLDLDAGIPGAETVVTQYATECDPGGSAELWTINGGGHSPPLTESFPRLVIEHLFAHPKPGACPEDLDGSDAVDFGDILQVLSAWGPCPPEAPCPEDLDGSGIVDFTDLLVVLAAWGPCPAG